MVEMNLESIYDEKYLECWIILFLFFRKKNRIMQNLIHFRTEERKSHQKLTCTSSNFENKMLNLNRRLIVWKYRPSVFSLSACVTVIIEMKFSHISQAETAERSVQKYVEHKTGCRTIIIEGRTGEALQS